MPETNNDSIVNLTRELVRVPSRAGIDDYRGVFEVVANWLDAAGVSPTVLKGQDGTPLALVAEAGDQEGPLYLLNATVDTAGFGDEDAWTHPPSSAVVQDGWMHGRGTADSKVGVAIFCHVFADWLRTPGQRTGALRLVFDADEHTGQFGGIRRALDLPGQSRIAGAFLGYPGLERIAVGGRGFERAVVTVFGRSAHSGSASVHGINAVHRAAKLAGALANADLPSGDPSLFPLPPKLSITAIEGGHGFSEVPDRCEVSIDARLVPGWGREEVRRLVTAAVADLDAGLDGTAPPTEIEWRPGWPAYRLTSESGAARALTEAANEVLPEVSQVVVGPSNVGNLLYSHGIGATCGFGVAYRNVHATDECIELSTIPTVFDVYSRAVRKLVGPE